jgi:hypothetical protein
MFSARVRAKVFNIEGVGANAAFECGYGLAEALLRACKLRGPINNPDFDSVFDSACASAIAYRGFRVPASYDGSMSQYDASRADPV